MDEKPDMVVSGINHGQNVATNVIYSGTVSAATEGMILGIPSVAVSMASFNPVDFSVATEYALKVIKEVAQRGLPKDSLLSINIPDASREEVKGIKICRLGISKFEEVFEKRVDPRQNDYFWQGGQMLFDDEDSDADIVWLHNNWVTVTPIHFDLTNYEFMGELDNWEFSR
jgi:5'-nucleotidase